MVSIYNGDYYYITNFPDFPDFPEFNKDSNVKILHYNKLY